MSRSRTVFIILIHFALLSALFWGCSEHLLQDLINGRKSTPSSEHDKESKDSTYKVPPSKNKALNTISPSSTADDTDDRYRYLQKRTNSWITEEWEPLTQKKEGVTESNITIDDDKHNDVTSAHEENNNFSLQHYVDKAALYIENKKRRDENRSKVSSHLEKINTLPVIGTSKKKR